MNEVVVWIFSGLLLIIRLLTYHSELGDIKQETKIKLTTKVYSEPLRYSNKQRLILKGLIIYLPEYPEINYGDEVVIKGIYKDGKLEESELLDHRPTKNIFFSARQKIIGFYKKTLPEPYSALVAGVSLGVKQSLPWEFYETLKKTGTAHVVVASGMNVVLVGGFILNSLVGTIKRKTALAIAIASVWIYTAVAGFDAPLIRASLMVTIAFTAQNVGRVYNSLRSLLLVAVIMLFIKPAWVGDLGFILSFLSTLGLILFESKVSRLLHFVPKIVRSDLSTSISAQIAVSPVLFLVFGQINPLSPLINALVLWTIPPITIIGIISGIVSILSQTLGGLVLLLSYPLTYYFVEVIKLFS